MNLSRVVILNMMVGLGLMVRAVSAPLAHADGIAARYVVREGCNLREVSLRLYGTTRYWRQIASWNGIRGPRFGLKRGQVLSLRLKPKLSPEQGAQVVLEFWRERLNALSPEAEPIVEKSSVAVPPPEEIRKTFESQMDQLQVEAAATGVGPSLEEVKQEKSRDAQFAEAQELFKIGRFEDARKIYAGLREQEPARPEYWLREMACLMALQKRSEARALVIEFKDQVPELKGLPFLQKILSSAESD